MHPAPDQLANLQDSIHREKALRARAMTESERFAATLELIDTAFSALALREFTPNFRAPFKS